MKTGDFARVANEYGAALYPATDTGEPYRFYSDEQIAAFDRGENVYDYVGECFP